MSDIRFYIPKDETIPTSLRLYVGDVFVTYKRIDGGYIFRISTHDETQALEVARKIADRMIYEQSEPRHGVSWVTVSMNIVPQESRYAVDTMVEWKYRVRDSY